ncbi:MAG: hypothetical protein J07HB67_00019 [halophilic archaeon J07HB67]|jgi:hypothetical protein|nr:MAG: hypothetical protein J07HB67_00019 [halophilic archaeon J07HB67]
MERRTVLKRLGAASAGLAGLSGVASAENPRFDEIFAGVGSVDVSSRSGQVSLSEVMTDEQIAQTSDDVDPTTPIVVDESDTEITLDDQCGCYIGCCEWDNPCVGCCKCVCDNCDSVRQK